MSKPCTIKVRGAGRYNGEYSVDESISSKQDLDEWEARLRSVGCENAVVELGHFTFGKNDPEDGRFHQKAVRYLQDRQV